MKSQFNVFAAGMFYLFYVSGIFWFGTFSGIKAGSVFNAALSGLFLGLLAYSTYEITNFATLKGWTIQMVIIDTIWGGVLGGLTATVGFYTYRFFSN